MLSPTVWLGLKPETRRKLATVFSVPKTGVVEVVNNRVACDGHTPKDLMAISVEKLQKHTGLKMTDFYKLFEASVKIVEDEGVSLEPVIVAPPIVMEPVVIPNTNAKHGKRKAKA